VTRSAELLSPQPAWAMLWRCCFARRQLPLPLRLAKPSAAPLGEQAFGVEVETCRVLLQPQPLRATPRHSTAAFLLLAPRRAAPRWSSRFFLRTTPNHLRRRLFIITFSRSYPPLGEVQVSLSCTSPAVADPRHKKRNALQAKQA